MESSVVQQRTSTKGSKLKEKPIEVVYISNPMKVKATASEFRALVQELTSQDAEFSPDLSRFHLAHDDAGGGDGHQTDSDNSLTVTKSDYIRRAIAMPDQVEQEANELGQVIGSSTSISMEGES